MIARPRVWAPLVPTCLCPWARYLVSIALLTWAYQGGIGRGKYYNLSANKVCTWPVAPLGEAKWLWRFPWYCNNRQQRFVSSGKRRYANADIIIIYLLFYYQVIIILPIQSKMAATKKQCFLWFLYWTDSSPLPFKVCGLQMTTNLVLV